MTFPYKSLRNELNRGDFLGGFLPIAVIRQYDQDVWSFLSVTYLQRGHTFKENLLSLPATINCSSAGLSLCCSGWPRGRAFLCEREEAAYCKLSAFTKHGAGPDCLHFYPFQVGSRWEPGNSTLRPLVCKESLTMVLKALGTMETLSITNPCA